MKKYLIALSIVFMSACATVPESIEPIKGFEVNRYLGKWYEIARLDHSFERGLSNITAQYSLRDDGDIDVLNSGYNKKKNKWQQVTGRAKFFSESDVGSLKVSFFWPFYGGYHLIDLDKENYQYAMITGNDRSYFWLMSRTPDIAPELKKQLIEKASLLGFPVDDLIDVEHAIANPE